MEEGSRGEIQKQKLHYRLYDEKFLPPPKKKLQVTVNVYCTVSVRVQITAEKRGTAVPNI